MRLEVAVFAIAVFTVLGTLATLALLITLPNVFESESMLYIKIGRGTVAIDPATSASGSHISLMDSRQTEINSVKRDARIARRHRTCCGIGWRRSGNGDQSME